MITVKSTTSIATSGSRPPFRKRTLGRCAIGIGALLAAATLWLVARAPSSAETRDSVGVVPGISAAEIIAMNSAARDPAAAESVFTLVEDYVVGWGYVEFETAVPGRASGNPTSAQ
jgi:hypothetical protein